VPSPQEPSADAIFTNFASVSLCKLSLGARRWRREDVLTRHNLSNLVIALSIQICYSTPLRYSSLERKMHHRSPNIRNNWIPTTRTTLRQKAVNNNSRSDTQSLFFLLDERITSKIRFVQPAPKPVSIVSVRGPWMF